MMLPPRFTPRSALTLSSCRAMLVAGFTLMEMIVVIIILGAMAVGIAGFITLSTQTYVNVSERDELLSSARFAIERLNREVRNAVPNSIRVLSTSTHQCLEFVPTIASTIYTDIAVTPEAPRTDLSVIRIIDNNDNDYVCADGSCNDFVSVYPILPNGNDIYLPANAKTFAMARYTPAGDVGTITLNNNQAFSEHSPTNRAYIFNSPVSFCIEDNGANMYRYGNYGFNQVQILPNTAGMAKSLMAESLDNGAIPAFVLQHATLQRNAVVQIKLKFVRDSGSESVVFDNNIHINNVP